jgi:hypothetical protein
MHISFSIIFIILCTVCVAGISLRGWHFSARPSAGVTVVYQQNNVDTCAACCLGFYIKLTPTRQFDVHVTMRCDKFLIIKPTRCNNFSSLFLEWNSTCFGQFLCPSSGVFHCTYSSGICHTVLLTADRMEHPDPACKLSAKLYDIYHCCKYSENAWWWTEELSKTCRASFQK